MIAYPDTSFLCALYLTQDNSERALAFRATMLEPLKITRLLLWEFRQSIRFQAFRHSNNPALGYSSAEATKMIEDLAEDLTAGLVVIIPTDVELVLNYGERISKARTFSGGHRSFDILHVATALELGAKQFLSFDANQIRLAKAEGLHVPAALAS